MQGKSKSKAPFSQYESLQQQGAKIVWGSPSDASAIPSGDFDVVYDNNGKDMDACKPLIDAFKVSLPLYLSNVKNATPATILDNSHAEAWPLH